MSSALDAQPELRDDLKVVRREHEDRTEYIVKEPERGNYFRFGPGEAGLMQLMNGRRTPAEIADAAREQFGASASPGQVADFAHKLKRLGLVERTPAERHLQLMERLRKQKRINTRGRAQGSLLRLRFSLGDPNELFERLVNRLPWLWSPAFVGLCVVLFVAYAVAVAVRWEEFVGGAMGLYTFSGYGLADWALLWGIFVIMGGIHELGHGLTTRYFGGEVHEIGFMLLYFSPALFCDTNDAWTFERRSRRLWVTFAGPWIELAVTGVVALVWLVTEPGTFVHRAAFLAVLLGGISSVLSNANPLIPLDGYYALSDWLEIPNLRGRAFEYWAWLGKRYVLGMDVAEPRTTPRERRVFLVYGGLALLYSAAVAVLGLWWLVMVLGGFIGPWVWVIVALLAARAAVAASGRVRALGRTAVTALRTRLRERPRGWIAGGALVGLVGLLFVLPWTYRASGEFRVEAVPRAEVRAGVSGILEDVHVGPGDTVHSGQPLATLWNPGLRMEIVELRARADSLSLARGAALAGGDRTESARAARQLEEVREELAVLRQRARRLEVRAPIAGVVLAHRLRERIGERIRPGDLLLRLAGAENRIARARIPLTEAGGLASGQSAGMRLWARPGLEFRAPVERISPAADGDSVEAVIPIPGAEWSPPPGARGKVKIVTERATVAEAALRAVRKRVRLDLWL